MICDFQHLAVFLTGTGPEWLALFALDPALDISSN